MHRRAFLAGVAAVPVAAVLPAVAGEVMGVDLAVAASTTHTATFWVGVNTGAVYTLWDVPEVFLTGDPVIQCDDIEESIRQQWHVLSAA